MSNIITVPLVPDIPSEQYYTTDYNDTVDLTQGDDNDEYDSDSSDYSDMYTEDNIKHGHIRNTQTPNANHFYTQPDKQHTTQSNTVKPKPFQSHRLTADTTVSHSNYSNINSKIGQYEQKQAKNAVSRVKDRANRATIDSVLDQRTRIQINKLFIAQLITRMNGTISTGKEANVYSVEHTNDAKTVYYALKIYKTSILVFKDRDMYITGEQRFATYSKNPRKMVKLWAEKEYRNLKRLQLYGVQAPIPLALKSHVLLLSLIGDSTTGQAASKLKEAQLNHSEYAALYVQCIKMMRTMYIKCRLVHGDLSEYNMLVHRNTHNTPLLYIIDVSQSVEHEHPYAAELLKKDCINISKYFANQQCYIMTVRELYHFITTPDISDSDTAIDTYINNIFEQIHTRDSIDDPDLINVNNDTNTNEFVQTHIPRSLQELPNYEQTHHSITTNNKYNNSNDILIQSVKNLAIHNTDRITNTTVTSAGNKTNKSKITFALDLLPTVENQTTAAPSTAVPQYNESKYNNDSSSDSDVDNNVNQRRVRFVSNSRSGSNHSDSESDSDISDSDSNDTVSTTSSDTESEWIERPILTAEQLKAERKQHKKQVKLLQAEKRKDKIPKKVKKQKMKKHHKK